MSNRKPSGLVDVSQEVPVVWAAREGGGGMCHCYEVWDRRRRLVYVGIADDFERRWDQHLRSSWWIGEVQVWYVEVTTYGSRLHARLAEAAVINEQAPIYNTAHEAAAYREYERLSEIDSWPGLEVVAWRRFLPASVDGAVA